MNAPHIRFHFDTPAEQCTRFQISPEKATRKMEMKQHQNKYK